MEDRCRRNNVRLVGLPEGMEGMTYGHIRNIYGLELGTADVAYCSNVVSGIMVCECMCVQGAWL